MGDAVRQGEAWSLGLAVGDISCVAQTGSRYGTSHFSPVRSFHSCSCGSPHERRKRAIKVNCGGEESAMVLGILTIGNVRRYTVSPSVGDILAGDHNRGDLQSRAYVFCASCPSMRCHFMTCPSLCSIHLYVRFDV